MNSECSICTDLIWSNPSAHIVGTKCGHLFHNSCLTRWTGGQSRDCPQCRTGLGPRDVFRMYPNTPGRSAGDDDDAALLQTNLHSAQTLLNQQKELFKRREDKIKGLEEAAKKNEDLVRTSKEKVTQLTTNVQTLTQQNQATETSLNKRIQALNEQVNKTTEQLVNREATIKQLTDKTNTLNIQIDKHKGDNQELKNTIDTLKENIQKLEGELSTANKKLARRDAILAARQVVNVDQTNIIGGEDSKMDEIQNDVKVLMREIASLKRRKNKKKRAPSAVVTTIHDVGEFSGGKTKPLPAHDVTNVDVDGSWRSVSDDSDCADNREPKGDVRSDQKKNANESQNKKDESSNSGISEKSVQQEANIATATENEEVAKNEEVAQNAGVAASEVVTENEEVAQNAEVAASGEVAKNEEAAKSDVTENETQRNEATQNDQTQSKPEQKEHPWFCGNVYRPPPPPVVYRLPEFQTMFGFPPSAPPERRFTLYPDNY